MHRLVISIGILSACQPDKADDSASAGDGSACIAAAVEEEGAVALLDDKGALLSKVDLSTEVDGMAVVVEVHNVQTTSDGARLLATVVPAGDAAMEGMVEELVVVDVAASAVQSRITLGEDLHIAHVVTDDTLAWVTAYEADLVLEVDLEVGVVTKTFTLPAGTNPHGLRRLPDGSALIVAGMGDGSLHLVDLDSGDVQSWDLDGRVVQTAALPDGSAAFASIYDTQQVARLDLATLALAVFDLPEGAVGPVQIYPTPDSAGLWVADQGYLEGDPAGEHLYRLDARTGEVTLTARVSPAPHGVVVRASGAEVWATTLVDGTVDRVDALSGELLSSTAVGDGPNGITCTHDGAATP